MTPWRWAALAGLAALAISAGFGRIPGIDACGLGGDTILKFEFVRTPADVEALFPAFCRTEHMLAQRQGLWLDAMGFIPAYSAFLILSLIALRLESRPAAARLTGIAIILTLAAALCDQFEGLQLFAILADLPGTQARIDLLIPAVRTKFALLALVVAIAGWLHLQQPGWRKPAGALILGGALWSMAGLAIERDWLLQGSALAWLALFFTNVILATRRSV